jgi:hypothetical protein
MAFPPNLSNNGGRCDSGVRPPHDFRYPRFSVLRKSAMNRHEHAPSRTANSRRPRDSRLRVAVVASSCLCVCTPALAQQPVSVQQPVFGVNGVATTVVVPDGGRAVLGGVGRAASGTSRYGLGAPSRSMGSEVSGSSFSASVTVHDFAEMDARALARGPQRDATGRNDGRGQPLKTAKSPSGKLSPRAEWAWQNLSARNTPPQAGSRR